MRDLEFLPQWYVHARKRRRVVLLQGWVVMALGLGFSAWMILIQGNIRVAEGAIKEVNSRLTIAAVQLREMDRLSVVRGDWQQQDQRMTRLGLQVDTTRLLRTLDAAMPKEMSLTGMQLETEDRLPTPGVQPARLMPTADGSVEHRLKVRAQGVAPTDVDLANFMTQLSVTPFFEQVAMSYAKETSEAGRVMREFEVTFYINLSVSN